MGFFISILFISVIILIIAVILDERFYLKAKNYRNKKDMNTRNHYIQLRKKAMVVGYISFIAMCIIGIYFIDF